MKIVQSSFKILRPASTEDGIDALRFIERCARVSHGAEEKQTETSYDRFLRSVVLAHGDWSVAEHVTASVEFRINRGTSHEKVRHRHGSPTQSSTRFINYTKEGHEPEYVPSVAVKPEDLDKWVADLEIIDGIYRKWIAAGYAPQIARDFLPNALGCVLVLTCNLRNWRHLFIMRTTRETHPDYRFVMCGLLTEFQKLFPILYEDIIPEARQIDNLRLPR